MREPGLMANILDVLALADRPLTVGDILRRLDGEVQRDDVSSRLAKLKKQGKVLVVVRKSQAITGPRMINSYLLPSA